MAGPENVYVAAGRRSPFCKMDRELASLDALGLSGPVVQQTVLGEAREPGAAAERGVDLVLWGSVVPSLEVTNWGREVWLESRLEPHVPGQGIVQACATSLAAATHAAGQVLAGRAELVLCGGVESMSDTPIGLSRGLSGTLRGLSRAKGPAGALRTLAGVSLSDFRLRTPRVEERTTGKSMGEHCEEMARDWKIPREAQDELALESHRRAVAAAERGFFRPLLVGPGTFPVERDTLPRPDTTPERLAGLPPAFDGPQGTLTAGNSSPLTDGAAACWVASEAGLSRLDEDVPRARLRDWEEAAVDLEADGLLMAPALAIPRLLARHDLGYDDIGLWEVHEAFAAQVLCTIAALEDPAWRREKAGVDSDPGPFPRDRMNPNGGSVALGHPFAATGARILSQAAAELADRPAGTLGVVSICAAGGLGHVALLEAV